MRVPNLNKVLKAISDLNHIYNEQLTLHKLTKTPCPDSSCGLDPVTKQGRNSLCPTCKGVGYTTVDTTLTVPASVEKNNPDNFEILPVGTVFSGNIWMTLDAKEITQYSIDVTKYDFYTWQNTKYRVVQVLDQYLQGVLYELQVELERMM